MVVLLEESRIDCRACAAWSRVGRETPTWYMTSWRWGQVKVACCPLTRCGVGSVNFQQIAAAALPFANLTKMNEYPTVSCLCRWRWGRGVRCVLRLTYSLMCLLFWCLCRFEENVDICTLKACSRWRGDETSQGDMLEGLHPLITFGSMLK
jgi:hypothetical protein